MKTEIIHSFFKDLSKDNLCFIYLGNISDDITDRLISLSEVNINNITELSKLKKKVSMLMAECFQNIVRHGEPEIETENDFSYHYMFLTRNIGTAYYISSANLIENAKVAPLKEKLERINSLTESQLRNLYLDVLINDEMSAKGGAGLGIIEMARKSGHKLDFAFKALNDKFSYFYLQVSILNDELPSCCEVSIESSIEFHQKMAENNIIMLHKGNFSQEAIMPVLKMVENNMLHLDKKNINKKRAYHLLVESLQNISRHGWTNNGHKEGIFLLQMAEQCFNISTGNFIENTKAERLKEKTEVLLNLTIPELNDLYKKTLRNGQMTEGGGAGLGLIDMIRESEHRVSFGFTPYTDTVSFFTISIDL
jgi:hypothetical protein